MYFVNITSVQEIAKKYFNRSQGGAKLSEQDFVDAITEYSQNIVNFQDMNGKFMEIGHIVAVRYVWNSYVGVIGLNGLLSTGALRHAFFSPHELKRTATYQIIGHRDESHKDYNKAVYDWYYDEKNTSDCPVELNIYKNVDVDLKK